MSSIPSTPASRTLQRTYKPRNSSPLVSASQSRSSSLSSPPNAKSTAERRRLQFKSHTPIARSSTLPSSSPSRSYGFNSRTHSVQSSGSTNTSSVSSRQTLHSSFGHAQDTQKQLLRERIKAKCFERVQKAKARAVKKRRYSGYSDRSSDGFDVEEDDDDDEEDDDTIMGDELFRRIMAQTNRKTDHSYRLSYALEVGSSFDPDLEDVAEWEHEVKGAPTDCAPDLSPSNIDDEELDAYAEECARQAVLDEFADIPEEELLHWSDVDDVLDDHTEAPDNMDLS